MTNKPDLSPSQSITLLQRREIQAGLVVKLIQAFAAEMGQEKALEIARQAIAQDAEQAGREAAAMCGGNSLTHLAGLIRNTYTADGSLEFEVLAESETEFHIDIHRCLFAELYDRMGIREYGDCLSCSRDDAFLRGFNPRIKLVRTHTIMEGAESCDFRYSLEKVA
jgi:L-2-amino-thiazoline-4-carboxylic acid hydrolase